MTRQAIGWTVMVAATCTAARAQEPPLQRLSRSEVASSTTEFELPIDAEVASQVDTLISQLASPRYAARAQATEALIDIGARALPQLREAYHQSQELEVRMLLEEIVVAAYFDFHVFNRFGFLGVSMRPYVPRANQKNRTVLPEGRAGLVAAQVIENTGAMRAGMKKNDVIIELDGKPLSGAGRQVLNTFSAAIRAHKPGEIMSLKVMRGSKELSIEATLGRCPRELAKKGTVRGTSQLLRLTEVNFPYWWKHHFRPTAAP